MQMLTVVSYICASSLPPSLPPSPLPLPLPLPTHRIANNTGQVLQATLGITDSQHKQKIQLRAMDVVLFGPPNGEEGGRGGREVKRESWNGHLKQQRAVGCAGEVLPPHLQARARCGRMWWWCCPLLCAWPGSSTPSGRGEEHSLASTSSWTAFERRRGSLRHCRRSKRVSFSCVSHVTFTLCLLFFW